MSMFISSFQQNKLNSSCKYVYPRIMASEDRNFERLSSENFEPEGFQHSETIPFIQNAIIYDIVLCIPSDPKRFLRTFPPKFDPKSEVQCQRGC